MKTNKSKPIFITREYPLIFLYLAAISLSLMYVISRSRIVVCTIVMTVLSIGVFMLFYVLRKHKGFAALAAMALGFVCMTLLYMGQYTRGGNSIMDYIFTASSFFDPFFAGVLCVLLFFGIFPKTLLSYAAVVHSADTFRENGGRYSRGYADIHADGVCGFRGGHGSPRVSRG